MAKVWKITGSGLVAKPTYRVTNWKAYNQGLVKRGSLTLWLDSDVEKTWYFQGKHQRGAQFEYSATCILMILTLRSVFLLPFRQTQGFVQSVLDLAKIGLKVPCYTQVCRRQAGLKVPPKISERLKNGENIYVVADSSGLKVFGEGEWKVRQHGCSKRRTWRKIHLGVDEKTGEIVAQTLTENSVDDAEIVPEMVKQAQKKGVKVGRFAADGAYDKRKCYDVLLENGIEPIIPPREDAQYWFDKKGEPLPHPRNFALMEIDEGGQNENRKQWKINANYHRRSLSETTFFRWKVTFGDKLAARKLNNQKTEAAVKSAILNTFIQMAKPVSVRKAA